MRVWSDILESKMKIQLLLRRHFYTVRATQFLLLVLLLENVSPHNLITYLPIRVVILGNIWFIYKIGMGSTSLKQSLWPFSARDNDGQAAT